MNETRITLVAGAYDSPLGVVRFATREGNLCALGFASQWPELRRGLERRFGGVRWRKGAETKVAAALGRYFAGNRNALEKLPVDTEGTPFQRDVWAALRRVGPGETISYAELARRIGRPRAVRAVGAANGANPVSLVVPCHRVVRKGGALGGYGGGVERKRRLLELEGAR